MMKDHVTQVEYLKAPYFSCFKCYPWEISLGNMVLAFTVMLMILSSIFIRDPIKHTNLQN